MKQVMNSLAGLPTPVKLGGGAVTLGVLGAGLSLMQSTSAKIALIGGLMLLGLALIGYQAALRALARRKAAPMERSIAGNAAAAPAGVSEPAKRARLDDLRKNFEGGVEKFRAAGKNVYSLPWYLLVGEPGAGKTEAIRHCNVGFPPGLQDFLQGAGGTLNMNWWFTNHAIILDTAGRLMFEEVEAGSTGEWHEFLKLLRRVRPNCPVNGMLLVIPADTLVKDNADAIERKAGRIAQQLDQIQRALGVRFPVYIIIAKCDLINGFREFFDGVDDPVLQHQILGWSNPDPLDAPFRPDQVEQHLRAVRARLVRRRAGLLQDPVHTEDPSARRADQVDALFNFPDAFMELAPRLRRYLEMIFVAGEWSQKPLFLRGIYFTSSMREGAALDADLAALLNMPVDKLPPEGIFRKDVAYFLRDLFIKKVFPEQGLVTRAANTSVQQRRNRAALLGAAAAGVLALGGFTWMGYAQLQDSVGKASGFWAKSAELLDKPPPGHNAPSGPPYWYPIVTKDPVGNGYLYQGRKEAEELAGLVDRSDKQELRVNLAKALDSRARTVVDVPPIFRPVGWISGDRGDVAPDERRAAARALFEASVLRPLVDACMARLASDAASGAPWTPAATAALAQLLRLDAATLDDPASRKSIDLGALAAYALRDSPDLGVALADLATPGAFMATYYNPSLAQEWPPQSLAGSRAPQLLAAAQAFASACKNGLLDEASELTDVATLRDDLEKFDKAEQTLLQTADRMSEKVDAGAWSRDVKLVSDAAKAATEHAAFLAPPGSPPRTLAKAYEEARGRLTAAAKKGRQDLLDELRAVVVPGKDPADPFQETALAAEKKDARAEALAAVGRLISQIDTHALGGDATAGARVAELQELCFDSPFAARVRAYETVDTFVKGRSPAGPASPGATRAALLDIASAAANAGAGVREGLGHKKADLAQNAKRRHEQASDACAGVLRLAGQDARAAVVDAYLHRTGSDNPDFHPAVRDAAGPPPERPAHPMRARDAAGILDARYAPAGAAKVLGDAYATIGVVRAGDRGPEARLLPADAGARAARCDKIRTAAKAYLRDYADYWGAGVADGFQFAAYEDWKQCRLALQENATYAAHQRPLEDLLTACQGAASGVLRAMDPAGVAVPVREPAHEASTEDLKAAGFQDEALVLAGLDRANARAQDSLQKLAQPCGAALAAWSRLPESVPDARAQLVGGSQKYLPVPAGDPADFVSAYWRRLTTALLTRLADDADRDVNLAVAAVTRLGQKFPIAPFRTPPDELTLEDVLALRSALDQLPPQPRAATGAPADGPDGLLDRLTNGRGLSEVQVAAIKRCRAVLPALPTSNKPQKCVVYNDAGKRASTKPGGAISNGIGNTGVGFGDLGAPVPQAEQVGLGVGNQAIVTTDAPLPAGSSRKMLSYYLVTNAATQPVATVPIPSSWPGMYLIAMYGGTMDDDAGKVWTVEVPVLFGGVEHSHWIRLEFSPPLPKDWSPR